MLQKLNERIQGLVAWVVISLVAITFTLFGVDYYLQSRQSSSLTMADVDGKSITKQAFELAYQRLRQLREANMSAAAESQLKQQLLDDLVLKQVSLNSAQSYGFSVTPSQVTAAILQIPQFQENGQFSTNRYQHVLSSAWFTHESFQHEVHEGMLMNQQRFAFIGTSFALPNEVEQYVKLQDQTRNYRYILIPSSHFSKQVSVSPEEAHTYYTAHRQAFLAPEQVSIEYVTLSVADIKARIHPSRQDLLQYYNDNQANYLDKDAKQKPFSDVKDVVKEQWLADRVQTAYASALEELSDLSYQTPDSLEPVAEKLALSLKRSSLFSRDGGENKITKNKQILQTAFSRDVLELGNNSAPIQLDNENVIVLRVNKRVAEKEKAFSEVADEIDARVRADKAQKEAVKLGEVMLHAKDDARDLLVKDNHLSWQDVKKASRDTTDTALLMINEIAYTLPAQKKDALSGQPLTDDRGYVLVELQRVENGDVNALDAEQRASISKGIAAADGVLDYDLYINQLLTHANVIKN